MLVRYADLDGPTPFLNLLEIIEQNPRMNKMKRYHCRVTWPVIRANFSVVADYILPVWFCKILCRFLLLPESTGSQANGTRLCTLIFVDLIKFENMSRLSAI